MILGIDLGTSNSLAAAYKDGEVILVKSASGSHIIPSVISIDDAENLYTGDMALKRKKQYPHMTVDMFKRNLGTGKEFILGEKTYHAEQLSAILLGAIKKEAETFFNESITEAVISVPAFFNNFQRTSVMQAGKLAGFEVKRIVNEPTAAAIAYGIQNIEEAEEKVIIVLDLGGGTFDISVMEVGENVMEVVAICGDNKLGGGDFTNRLITLFKRKHSIDFELSADEESFLWNEAQKAKHQITAECKGEIHCTIDNKEYEFIITEAEYEEACEDLLEKIRKLTLQAVEESGYEPYEIQDIIMVGGGTKLSIVKKMIERMIAKDIDYKINPEEAVVRGVALQGALLNRNENIKEIVMTDICAHYIGCPIANHYEYDMAKNFDVMIKKNTTIPVKQTTIHYFSPGSSNFGVWQSENEWGIDATLLDSVPFIIPDLGDQEEVEVHKSITYNADGIIFAEVYIPANDMTYSKVVMTEGIKLSETEIEKSLSSFGLKEHDENTHLLARADRVYAEAIGNDRKIIGDCIKNFEIALNAEKKTQIRNKKEALEQLLDAYESSNGEL